MPPFLREVRRGAQHNRADGGGGPAVAAIGAAGAQPGPFPGSAERGDGRRTGSLAEPEAMLTSATIPTPMVIRARRLASGIDPLGILGLLLFILTWQLITGVLPPSSLPTPWSVVERIGHDFIRAEELSFYGLADTGLLDSIIYTATNVLIAVALGSATGTLAGLVTSRFHLVRAVLDPIVMTTGTIPILVLAPFFLIWFGVDRMSAVLLVAIYVGVILYVFAQRAADNIDPVYEESAYTLGATPRRVIWNVLIPATVPQILGGIRIALAGAWGLEAIAELLGAQYGIGKIVQVLAGATDIEGIFAALIVLGLVAVLFDALAALAVSRVAAWNLPARAGGE
jgi:ABC-type nitrate/sulfonate/bicarbonate transport system permease component